HPSIYKSFSSLSLSLLYRLTISLNPFDGGISLSLVELNALQTELGHLGLVVLGFPCNQFGKQEPGENSEILPGLKYVRPGNNFVPNFQLFQKGDVNGEKEQRVYTFLKWLVLLLHQSPFHLCTSNSGSKPKNVRYIHDIKWNFEKFLVGPDGKPVMRWFPRTNVATVKNDIIKYMREHMMFHG
uniref:Glutathione peroxidase n=1 Tax=Varanus komodoensis TaxID=61221 RepID=A0A8D2IYG4_VARKO